MILFFVVIVIVIACCASSSKDKRSEKQMIQYEESLSQLPDLCFRAKEMTSAQKALNMWPSDKDILKELKYQQSDRTIYLEMKDGRFILCPISDLEMSFDKVGGLYKFIAKHGKTTFSFYQFAYVFTDKEWEIIINTLILAGTTRNVAIFGSTYKALSKANMVLKIIKALS